MKIVPSWPLLIIDLDGSSEEFEMQKWSLCRDWSEMNAKANEQHVLQIFVDHSQCQSPRTRIVLMRDVVHREILVDWMIGFVFVLRAIPVDNVNWTRNPSLLLFAPSSEHEVGDVFHQWANITEFLCALSSVCLPGTNRAGEDGTPADSDRMSMEPISSDLHSSLVTQFIADRVKDFVYQNEKFGLQVRQHIKGLLGDELSSSIVEQRTDIR